MFLTVQSNLYKVLQSSCILQFGILATKIRSTVYHFGIIKEALKLVCARLRALQQ